MSKHKHHDHDRRQQFVTPPLHRGRALSWNMVLAIGAVVLLGTIAATVVGRGRGGGRVFASAGVAGADVTLPLEAFADGQARFYKYVTTAGQEVRFFVMKSADGVVRAAYDACDVCYRERKGYHQEGDDMVCNNCGRHFPSRSINDIEGGCNPAPLERAIRGNQVVISAAAVAAGVAYF
jgi:hypothetical protein